MLEWPATQRTTPVNKWRYFTFLTIAAVIASAVAVHDATAQYSPIRPLTMVLPFTAGSSSDNMTHSPSVRRS